MKLAEKILAICEMSLDDAKKIFNFKSGDDVDSAYKKLAMQHHPDRGGSTDMMKKVNAAYDILKKSYGGKQAFSKTSFDDAKAERAESQKRDIELVEKIVGDLSRQVQDALPEYEKHFSPYFKLNKPVFKSDVAKPRSVWDYIRGGLRITMSNDDNTTYVQLVVKIYPKMDNKGLGSGGDLTEYEVDYETFLYHNRKVHKMAKRYAKWNRSSSELLNPESVFPVKKLKTVLAKKVTKMGKQDFTSGIQLELKKYNIAYWRHTAKFVLEKPIKDNIHMELSRSTYNRKGAWHIYFRRFDIKIRSSQGALMADALPSHIRYSIFTVPENMRGFELLLDFVKDIYTGKTIDKDYFKDAFETNEDLTGSDMKLAEKILEATKLDKALKANPIDKMNIGKAKIVSKVKPKEHTRYTEPVNKSDILDYVYGIGKASNIGNGKIEYKRPISGRVGGHVIVDHKNKTIEIKQLASVDDQLQIKDVARRINYKII